MAIGNYLQGVTNSLKDTLIGNCKSFENKVGIKIMLMK